MMTVNGKVEPCCALPDNLILLARGSAQQPNGRSLPTEVKQCIMCDRKHYRLYVGEQLAPGRVGIG